MAWSWGVASLSDSKCLRGQIRMCVGACGLMSSNAKTSGSSYTIFEGIFFAEILQNRQSALIGFLLQVCPRPIASRMGRILREHGVAHRTGERHLRRKFCQREHDRKSRRVNHIAE